MPQYPAASYQHASYSKHGHLHSLFPSALKIRVAVRSDNGLLTVQAMPIPPGIRLEELIRRLLLVCGLESGAWAINQRLLGSLLMRRIVICTVVLSVVGATRPHDMSFSFS